MQLVARMLLGPLLASTVFEVDRIVVLRHRAEARMEAFDAQGGFV